MADSQMLNPEDWLVAMVRGEISAERPLPDAGPPDGLLHLAVATAAANRADENGRPVALYRLRELLVAGDLESRTSVRLQSDDPTHRWTVTQLYQDGDEAGEGFASFYLIFECRKDDLALYRGRTVTILHDAQPFDLGVVDEQGVAAELFDKAGMVINRRQTLVAV